MREGGSDMIYTFFLVLLYYIYYGASKRIRWMDGYIKEQVLPNWGSLSLFVVFFCLHVGLLYKWIVYL